MTRYKILVKGYAKKTPDGWRASSTATLVQQGEINIVVDPGINREALLKALEENNLKTEDIDWVLATHYHPDHIFLDSVFPRAKLLDDGSIYDGDKIYRHGGKIPGTNLEILKTPGHAYEHCALIVPTKTEGKIGIAGDVFWWTEDEEQVLDVNHDDPFVMDREALIASRKKLLNLCDVIIPGHGNPMKVM